MTLFTLNNTLLPKWKLRKESVVTFNVSVTSKISITIFRYIMATSSRINGQRNRWIDSRHWVFRTKEDVSVTTAIGPVTVSRRCDGRAHRRRRSCVLPIMWRVRSSESDGGLSARRTRNARRPLWNATDRWGTTKQPNWLRCLSSAAD